MPQKGLTGPPFPSLVPFCAPVCRKPVGGPKKVSLRRRNENPGVPVDVTCTLTLSPPLPPKFQDEFVWDLSAVESEFQAFVKGVRRMGCLL